MNTFKGDMTMLEKEVAQAIDVLDRDGLLLVTLSGGADSVALLSALQRIGAKIVAAHCNFHLRGEESNRDQQFVEQLCRDLHVELHIRHFDVEAYRKSNGGSMEMACRELRYAWFDELCAELECTRMLTAHHADDNVETMLLNLLRGCGLEGAKGMVADNGRVMRPLLRVHRTDIERYLRSINRSWIVDSTNLDSEPDRNFLRLRVLPLLEERFNDASRRLARSQKNLAEDYSLFRQWSSERIGSDTLYVNEIMAAASPASLLHEWLRSCRFSASQQQEMLRESLRAGGGTRLWQADDMIVLLDAEKLRRLPAGMSEIEIREAEIGMSVEQLEAIKASDGKATVYFPLPLNHYRLRTPHKGEKMRISPNACKKVSDLLGEEGVPLPYRSQYPVLADPATDAPLWLPFVRRAFSAFVNPAATHCYRFTAHQ